MRKEYTCYSQSNGLKLASTYYPSETNTSASISENLKSHLQNGLMPLEELKKTRKYLEELRK